MSKELIDWTSRRIAEVQQETAVRYDERQRDFPCSPGDLVFIREETQKSKRDMKWSELHRVQSIDDNKLNVVVTRSYGADYKPVTVNVQRLRLPRIGAQLPGRQGVPSQEPDPEDEEFDEVEAYRKLLLSASTVALLGKKLPLEDDRQRTNPIVAAEGMECETGGAKELPETLETADNLHRPLDSGESISDDLLLTLGSSGEPQLQR